MSIVNAIELMEMDISAPRYLLESILPQSGTAVLAGKPDIGKSQLARQLCISVALGLEEFLGYRLGTNHKSAIYISTEDNKDATRYLLNKQLNGLSQLPTVSLRFIFGESMEPREIINKLTIELDRSPADLVVVDSFGDIFNGMDGNNNMANRNSVKPFSVISANKNCLILFIHHINKGAYGQAPGQEHIQGGSGLVQKIRTALILTDAQDKVRHLSLVKGNYSAKKMKQNSIVLEFDEESLLFKNTGTTVSTSDLGTNNGETKEEKYSELELIASEIFTNTPITHTDFVRQYCVLTKKSVATAKRVLKNLVELALITKSSTGYLLTEPRIPLMISDAPMNDPNGIMVSEDQNAKEMIP